MMKATAVSLGENNENYTVIVQGDSRNEGQDEDEEEEEEDEEGCSYNVHPSVCFLMSTLVLTTCTTGILCTAIMTDHWEQIKWNHQHLSKILENRTSTIKLHWFLNEFIGKITTIHSTSGSTKTKEKFLGLLVPMHGGIWTLCVSLSDDDINLLSQKMGFPAVQPCANYLSNTLVNSIRGYEPRANWQHRMQNLSISCALVCLIILGSAALIGAFGVFHHQISAVLVTGVMYLLAACFALFTLTIINFKRWHTKPPHLDRNQGPLYATIDGVLINPQYINTDILSLLSAREFSTSWSMHLGWCGVILSVITSILWIFLSKIMRLSPIPTLI